MARGRPFRLLGAWAGPARRQRGQGLPPHVDRRMRCKLLAVGTKSLNTSVRASISSWRGQRAPVPCGGALEARRTSGVPPLSPRAAGGWTWPSPPAGAPSSLTALMSCRNPRRSRLENGAGSRPPEPRGRLSLLGHGQRGSPTCPAPRAGHSEALSVRAHGLEGAWRPGGLALTEGRAGLRAHPCPQPDTARGKHGPRGDLDLAS